MTELTVTIASPWAELIEDLVAQGRYPSAEEAVADAVSRLEQDEPETPEYSAWLRAEAQKGLDDIAAGRVVDLDLDEIYREAMARLDQA